MGAYPLRRLANRGIAILADPKTQSCDGHIFKERYVYFLQNNKLLDRYQLKNSNYKMNVPDIKIAYNQSAYIVDYLLKKGGTEKMKQLWKTGEENFKEIYGFEFDEVVNEINTGLNRKYPDSIKFNEEEFNKNCIE